LLDTVAAPFDAAARCSHPPCLTSSHQ
jgi:hypothetical protein